MPDVIDEKAIDGCIVKLKKLQRETRKSIQILRELQQVKKGEVEIDGITRKTCGGIHRRRGDA